MIVFAAVLWLLGMVAADEISAPFVETALALGIPVRIVIGGRITYLII